MKDETYLATMRTYWKRHQTFPSMARTCDVVGLSSSSSIFALVNLTEAGYLERFEGRIALSKRFFAILLSPVRAGLPKPSFPCEPEVLKLLR